MPKPKEKMTKPPAEAVDSRFASFQTDPRFRLPSKKHAKTKIDKRFSRMLKDNEFTSSTRVDRYGRKVKSDAKKKALGRLYEEEPKNEAAEAEVDDDEAIQDELRAVEEKYDPARGGGFSSSEDGSDSDSDSASDSNGRENQEEGPATGLATSGQLRDLEEPEDIEGGEVTNRIAIVNLDWDHVRSADLMALFSSFITSDLGKVEKVSIYPSEFGKERMRQEETDGPPKELFKNPARESYDESESDSNDDSDAESDDEQIRKDLIEEGDDQDFDSDALRKYQLDRLRYFYAVMICSSPETAQKIYESTDGTEYQSSSNFLDLRFVPDEVTFDDEPREECDRVPDSYKPIEFVTNALQSSKVTLTWDMHPEEASRNESIKRAFSGSRAEVEENDLRAYLASDSEKEDHDLDDTSPLEGENEADEELKPRLSKKELARQKMREALGLGEEAAPKVNKNAPVGDMQITFAPALTDDKPKSRGDAQETTIEKYQRKERERKELKRQNAKAKRNEHEDSNDEAAEDNEQGGDDLGFNDPFFTTEKPSAAPSKTSIRKEDRRKKREEKDAAAAASAVDRVRLTKVMAEDYNENEADHLDHFDMNEIVRAEKAKRKKGKSKSKGKSKGDTGDDGVGLQEGFRMDVEDDRFKAVFDQHEFAIDPSNPKFKGTEGMNKLLEEGRRKRKTGDEDDDGAVVKKKKHGKRI